jgi:hypothetical protein
MSPRMFVDGLLQASDGAGPAVLNSERITERGGGNQGHGSSEGRE